MLYFVPTAATVEYELENVAQTASKDSNACPYHNGKNWRKWIARIIAKYLIQFHARRRISYISSYSVFGRRWDRRVSHKIHSKMINHFRRADRMSRNSAHTRLPFATLRRHTRYAHPKQRHHYSYRFHLINRAHTLLKSSHQFLTNTLFYLRVYLIRKG